MRLNRMRLCFGLFIPLLPSSLPVTAYEGVWVIRGAIYGNPSPVYGFQRRHDRFRSTFSGIRAKDRRPSRWKRRITEIGTPVTSSIHYRLMYCSLVHFPVNLVRRSFCEYSSNSQLISTHRKSHSSSGT